MNRLIFCSLVMPALCIAQVEPKDAVQVEVKPLKSGVKASFRGLAVIDARRAWVSGSNGTVVRTADGGKTWNRVVVPYEPTKDKDGKLVQLDFRDVEVLPDGSIILMSIGSGETSRLYRSADDGKTWKVVLQNKDPKGFFDGITFSKDGKQGLLFGDPIDGRMDLYRTNDSGQTWKRVPEDSRPKLKDGEYGFAASGTGAAIIGNNIWIGTGGSVARVHRSSDAGRSWEAVEVPMRSGNESSGIFSIAFANAKRAVAIGGDYVSPNEAARNVSFTTDGGATWQAVTGSEMPHKACVQPFGNKGFLACGRTGIAYSPDGGRSWKAVSTDSYYVCDVDLASNSGFLAGKDGRIAQFRLLAR